MRQIKASEIKPGMTIRWGWGGITHECVVGEVVHRYHLGAAEITAQDGGTAYINREADVTVLSEPAQVQPEEPVTLCARIVVAGRKIYRWTEDPKEPWPWRGEALNGDPVLWSWGQLCGLGQVQVVPDQGWAVTDDTPEVPERIEVWPGNDEALRPYPWRDTDGDEWCWSWADNGWGYNHATFPQPFPECFPLTRVTNA